jgi:glycosyltransferase involved in cell wall biosynthesis
VAMLIQEYPPIIGGAEQELAAQAGVLARLGVDVHVLTRRWWPELVPFERTEAATVYRLPATGPKAVRAARYILASAGWLRRLHPDVLHAHELLSPTSAAIVAKWLLRRPILATVLRGGLLGDLAKIRRGWLGPLRKWLVLGSVDAFVVISKEIDRELQALGVPDAKRWFIPNGVDTERFRPATAEARRQLRAQLGLPEGKLVIFTGRLEREKRVDLLLTLWPELRAYVPDAHLVVLGKGSLEAEYRKRAVEHVHFMGGITDVAPYLRAADVFVLPSVTEGLSVSMLEAMACGLPALVTQVGGASDVVVHRENGWLVPPGETEPLLEALITLLDSDQLRRLLGSRARACVEERYALESVAAQMRAAYDRLLAN